MRMDVAANKGPYVGLSHNPCYVNLTRPVQDFFRLVKRRILVTETTLVAVLQGERGTRMELQPQLPVGQAQETCWDVTLWRTRPYARSMGIVLES